MDAFRCGDRVRKAGGLAIGSTGIVQKVDADGLLTVEWDVYSAETHPIKNEGITTRTAPELLQRMPRRVIAPMALPGGWNACLLNLPVIAERFA